MGEYTYENVKDAYKAIIAVGRANVTGGFFGPLAVQTQHRKNLRELNDKAKELYEKLMSDETINY